MSTVLVVEDRVETRRPLTKLLKAEGYHVIAASDAYEAAALIRGSHPDLVLLDIGIAPMDGLTMLRLLKEESPRFNVPVIVLTGSEDENTRERAQALGVKAHLVKSRYTSEELLKLVKRYISTPENSSELPTG